MSDGFSEEAAELMKYLEDGWEIHYAPVSGGLVGLNPATGRSMSLRLDAFLQLRARGIISLKNSMRQGHQIFHGRVDIFGRRP